MAGAASSSLMVERRVLTHARGRQVRVLIEVVVCDSGFCGISMCAPLRLARQFSECSSGGRALALGARGFAGSSPAIPTGLAGENLSAA